MVPRQLYTNFYSSSSDSECESHSIDSSLSSTSDNEKAKLPGITLIDSLDKNTTCLDSLKSFFSFKPSLHNSSTSTDPEKAYTLTSKPIYRDDIDNDDDYKLPTYSELITNSTAYYSSKGYHDNNGFKSTSTTFNSSHRLAKLRQFMLANKIGCYIIPSEDEHQSEYTSPKDQRREYISGFTGSAGIAIVTLTEAALSTDGRYFLQASKQLDGNWELLKQADRRMPTWQEWSLNRAAVGQFKSLGFDPKLIGYKQGLFFKEKCHELNIEMIPLMKNLVDKVMSSEGYKPELPASNKIFVHSLKYSGESSNDKINRLRSFLKEMKSFCFVVSQLEEIAWLLNLRGDDIPYNPVFFSYAIVKLDSISLYLDKSKLTSDVEKYLVERVPNLKIYRYSLFWDDLPSVKSTTTKTVYLSNYPNYALYLNIPGNLNIKNRSIITEFKGIKNETEIKGHKFAQLQDSISLIRLFAYIANCDHELTEIDVVNKSEFFRSQLKDFKGFSFETISSTGSNASIIHYSPTIDNNSVINKDNVFLLDSGSQFLNGTTDITRTLQFNKNPRPNEVNKYTLVLKGHLNISKLVFKKGTPSSYIDSLGRLPLQQNGGFNYNHGTGHGIDTFICVHSGPCGLSPAETSYNYKPLEVGNFISNEPGYYLDNEFGIRIESDMMVMSAGEDDLLKFDYLTLVPFCRCLIDLTILEKEEILWINQFYGKIRKLVVPYLVEIGDDLAVSWLLSEIEPFPLN